MIESMGITTTVAELRQEFENAVINIYNTQMGTDNDFNLPAWELSIKFSLEDFLPVTPGNRQRLQAQLANTVWRNNITDAALPFFALVTYIYL